MKILQTLKEKLHNLKEKLPKKLFNKKMLIILVVVVAIAGFAFFKFRKPKDMPIMAPEIRTTTLEKTSLVNSVSVNGTVKSINVVNVTTGLTYKVKEIAVQVGDNVKKGDIIAKLDSADIEKEIAEEKKKLAETKETAKIAFDKGTAKKDEAYNNAVKAEDRWHKAETARDVAYGPFKTAADSISVANSEYNTAYAQSQSLGLARNNAYNAQQGAVNAKNNADAAKAAADTAKTKAEAAAATATSDVQAK
ncbi:MAG: efflux RND transporter periplasmic adaptor subunit, partial [Oscillospiraceae bacterium]